MNFRRQGFLRTNGRAIGGTDGKKKGRLTIAVTLFTSLLLIACGSESDVAQSAPPPPESSALDASENSPTPPHPPLPPPPPPTSPLLGSWKGPCGKNRGETRLIGAYSRESHVFTDEKVQSHLDFFEDEKCQHLEVRATYTGTYATPEGTTSESKIIDFEYQRVTITPITGPGSDVLHWLGTCGIGEAWEREREIDVTEAAGNEQCLERSKGAIYTVHALKEDQLFLGVFDIRRNPETRPEELLEMPFVR